MRRLDEMVTPQITPRPPFIWVVGGPGSGKSTQAVRVMEKYDFTYLSSDYLIVEEITSGSHKGREFEEIIKKGNKVSDRAIMCLYKKVIFLKSGASCGFIIDGFPTTNMEAKNFERCITPVDMIIYLDCEDEELMERCRNRPTASTNVEPFNEGNMTKRIVTFRENIFNILKGREKRTLLVKASRTEDEVFSDISAGIDCLLKKRAEHSPDICVDKGPQCVYRKPKLVEPTNKCCGEETP